MRFQATIELNGKTATGIEVPEEVVTGLGSSKKPAVAVTINGYTYRSTVATTGGRYLIPVSADVRKSAGVAAGDQVEVGIEIDDAPREVTVPDDLRRALDADADARRFFDELSYSNKRRVVLPIEEAKTAETRQRRIEKAVGKLHDGQL
jgi:hypothetical protein